MPAIVAIGMWAVFQFINGFGAAAVAAETMAAAMVMPVTIGAA